MKREKVRDAREFDQTQLHQTQHGRSLHRDYSAHFWRWSFARRHITAKDNVLEIGCGQDRPLSKILTGGASPHVNHYVGVDLNKLKPSDSQRLTFMSEFNFVNHWKQLKALPEAQPNGFDVIVHLEVIEHMHLKYGLPFLKACHALLKPGGVMLMSTPCYDGKRHAANHIHEYTVDELRGITHRAGFLVERRFGTFMDIKHVGKPCEHSLAIQQSIAQVADQLSQYYDNDAISCIFAPLYPDHSRNNLWVCRKTKG